MHTWWESILGLNVKAVRENRFLWNGLTHLRDSWNGGSTLECLSPFLEALEFLRKKRLWGEAEQILMNNAVIYRAAMGDKAR